MRATANTDESLLHSSALRNLPKQILRATLKAQELLGMALGLAFIEFRDNQGAMGKEFVDTRLAGVDARDAEETARLLRERLEKIPERRRPHYSSKARYRILVLKQRNGWSVDETARRFALSPNTIYNWLARVNALDTGTETDRGTDAIKALGSLIQPDPPVRRVADVVRSLVRTIDHLGFGGNDKLAQILARAGYKLSARSVGRIRKETTGLEPDNEPTAETATRRTGLLHAKTPNHIFMADVTETASRFRIFRFRIAVVLDVFSRMPLASQTFYFKPTARQMTRLLRSAIFKFGKPVHFVSDQGSEFTAKAFRRYLRAIGIQQRFGAVGRYGSISIIERFWRTLKGSLRLRYTASPLVRADLDEPLRLELLYYAHFRPHAALDGATPAEIYFRKTPRHVDATDPPRARAGGGPARLPVRFAFLDKERRFPVLIREAA